LRLLFSQLALLATLTFCVNAFAQAADPVNTDETPIATDSVQEDVAPKLTCSSFVPPEELGNAERVALRGVACFESGEYVQALRHYRRAFEVSESPLLMGAIGRVFQEMGYPALAREYYNSYLLAEVSEKERIAQRLADVEQKLQDEAVPVRIETNPPGARVFLVVSDDHWELAGESPIETRLLPGEYGIVVRREGFRPLEGAVKVEKPSDPSNVKKQVTRLELSDPNALYDISPRVWRERGITVIITSIPFVAAGGTMLALGLGKESDSVALQTPEARDQMNQDASRLKTWGAASLAVGTTGVVVGSVLYLLGGPVETPSGPETAFAPWVGADGAGASARFSW
jgi:tetratricopeptide (TPR) repeat protein